MIQFKTTVTSIYDAGCEEASGNNLKAMVEKGKGTIYTSPAGRGDDEILIYLKRVIS